MKAEEKKNQQNLNTDEEQQESTQQQESGAQDKQKQTQQTDNKQVHEDDTMEENEQAQVETEEKSEQEAKKDRKKAETEKKEEEDKKKKKEKTEEKEEKAEEKSDKEKLAELQDKYLRLSAEYDNYRKRTLKEKMELTKSAGEDILKGLLPVMDDFERALQSIDESNDNQAVKDGVRLIYNKFKEFLQQQGIQEIEAQDKDFDTDKHEAISKVPAPNEEMKGKVVDVIQKGYYLNDKILRFAKVVVGE